MMWYMAIMAIVVYAIIAMLLKIAVDRTEDPRHAVLLVAAGLLLVAGGLFVFLIAYIKTVGV